MSLSLTQRHIVKRNTKNLILPVYIELTAGGGATGLVTTDFTIADASEFSYYRQGSGAAVDAAHDATESMGTGVLGTWGASDIVLMSDALMPGWYEVGIPDAAIATGADWVVVVVKPEDAAACEDSNIFIELIRSIAY
jgi:hypothetical protein